MELNLSILRHLIKEEINQTITEQGRVDPAEAAQSLATLLARLQGAGLNIDSIFNDAKQIVARSAGSEAPANRKEKKWSDADHDHQEEIAQEIEKENPGISKEKKMAFAGAQVNREKRKRNK